MQATILHVGPVLTKPSRITDSYALACFAGCLSPVVDKPGGDLDAIAMGALMDQTKEAATSIYKHGELFRKLVGPQLFRPIEHGKVRVTLCVNL